MISFIGSLIKYSFFTLIVLVLSHIIQIEGVTISQHVLNGMHFFGQVSPRNPIKAITEDYAKAMNTRTEALDKIDSEVSPQDQKALNQVIEKSKHKK